MKKSERYEIAMLAVVASDFAPSVKLEVIETLFGDKAVAELVEKVEEEEK